MIEWVTLAVCCLILIIVALYPAYARLMAGIMANQLDEKSPREKDSAMAFDAVRRDVVELVEQLEKVSGWIGANRETNDARELVRRIKHEYGIPSPE